ncbi:hypothetical protein CC1G_13068 [Coprinopsis cinerea okayama7|uniref:Uncharacterized protein n=1 Tax=Coprinopsis cinerea (strain Okayama-7 / 130 / ATCC MYA-4618 / FGSC 9003) TaxID=240176 RepID=A8PD86_COPC7|nr:hypothetical protein CC1G_13068 [Coprinopsis cinerea okayama7\|eukprot:XP_001840556.1 hypothetical protein CC1G_13068 [Coprinopsis cinerea okayama7\
MASTFPKRRDILDNGDFGLELTDESRRHLGFRQVANGNRNVLRGAHNLRRETPHIAAKWRADFEQLAVQGLCGDAFWDLFIQCMDCNVIMPRFLFPYKHSCSNRAIRQRHHIWDPSSPSFMNRLRYQSDDDDTASDESGPSTAPCSPVPLRGSGLQLRSKSSIYQTPPPRPVPQSPIAKRKLHEVEDGNEGDDEDYLRACARRRLPSSFDDSQEDVFTYRESSSDLPELADIIDF